MKKKTKTKISEKMNFMDIVQKVPDAGEIFAKAGLHCIGCAGASFESLEAGCLAHGLDKKTIKKLVEELNKSAK